MPHRRGTFIFISLFVFEEIFRPTNSERIKITMFINFILFNLLNDFSPPSFIQTAMSIAYWDRLHSPSNILTPLALGTSGFMSFGRNYSHWRNWFSNQYSCPVQIYKVDFCGISSSVWELTPRYFPINLLIFNKIVKSFSLRIIYVSIGLQIYLLNIYGTAGEK